MYMQKCSYKSEKLEECRECLKSCRKKKIAQTNNETKPMLQGRLSGLERIKTL